MKRGQCLSTKRQLRVLIADSHELFCAGLAGLLEAVREVDSVVAATEVAERSAKDRFRRARDLLLTRLSPLKREQ